MMVLLLQAKINKHDGELELAKSRMLSLAEDVVDSVCSFLVDGNS